MDTQVLILKLNNTVPFVHVGYIAVPYTEENLTLVKILQEHCNKVNLSLKTTTFRTKRLPVIHLKDTEQLKQFVNHETAYKLRTLVYFHFEKLSYVKRKEIIRNNFPNLRYVLY